MRNIVMSVSILALAIAVWLSKRHPALEVAPPKTIVTARVAPSSENRPLVPESVEAVATSEPQIESGNVGMQPRSAFAPAPSSTPAVVLQMVDQRGLKVLPTVRENEQNFMIEPLDPLWSHSRETEILGQLALASGARLSTVEVECRTSICRLQFTQNVANGSAEHRGIPSPFYAEFLARLGYEQTIRPVMARDNAGTVASLVYLPRQ